MGYLDNAGLTKLWAKMKAYVDNKLTSGMPNWKYFNEGVVDHIIDISELYSNGASEIKLIFTYKVSTVTYVSSEIQIPLNITTSKLYLTGYYYSSAFNGCLAVYINPTNKQLKFDSGWSKVSGGDDLATAKIQVYYR